MNWLKLSVLIIFLIILSGCSLLDEYSWEGLEEIKTIEAALLFMRSEIDYRRDTGDYWQYPDETYELKTGDCEDMSALLAHLFIYNVGLNNVKLIGCVRKLDNIRHMMIRYNDIYYESVEGRISTNYKEIYYTTTILSYQNYIHIAKLHHL